MRNGGRKTHRKIICGLVLIGMGLPILLAVAATTGPATPSGHQIHIAFGFHVNLYHSFRNDTNDESGFGKDIRIIRHIIDTLDRFNARGIPVKGVWDFDNLFSLQELLPKYAPDIIADIRRRVQSNGDEVILMSYNNGLVSAMTEQELEDAVRWAISNPWQSGVKDLFGRYTPIVRPQEMMTTPGNFSIYQRHGIHAAALYYSATPFDAFRVFSRRLTRVEAHNPIRYHHPQTQEEMVIVPTYHFGDLVEHVSLKNWVHELRRLQADGEFQQDALIFINYDADSELWQGVDLPWPLGWLPNTDGLAGLIEEVADLPYVRFTTLGPYLEDHPPVGTVEFSQDTADGSYNGYNSWAEKADIPDFWTEIERSRRVRAAALKSLPFLSDPAARTAIERQVAAADIHRLRALSTTNYGMATPFLAPQRQRVMARILADLRHASDQIARACAAMLHRHLEQQTPPLLNEAHLTWYDTVMVFQTTPTTASAGHRFLQVTPPPGLRNRAPIVLVRPNGTLLPTIDLGDRVDATGARRRYLYVMNDGGVTDGMYHLFTGDAAAYTGRAVPPLVRADVDELANGHLAVRFTPLGRVEGIYHEGVRVADGGSLLPRLTYDQRPLTVASALKQLHPAADGQSASISLTGAMPAPSARGGAAGWMDYRFTLLADHPWLLIEGRITYPATERADLFKAGEPGLAQPADMQWQEVAPAEIRFSPRATRNDPVKVLKRNYLEVETEYRLDYFRHDPRNLALDNINNHITPSYVGIVSGKHGMAVAKDNSRLSNFAFAPLKMRHHDESDEFSIRVNPFGTYQGRQYHPPTWGNGQGHEVTRLTGEQFASAAPTYNGKSQDFALLLAFFNGERLPEEIKQDLIGFAHPPVVISARDTERRRLSLPALRHAQATSKQDGPTVAPPSAIGFSPGQSKSAARQEVPLALGIKVLWSNLRVRAKMSSYF